MDFYCILLSRDVLNIIRRLENIERILHPVMCVVMWCCCCCVCVFEVQALQR